MAIEPPTSGSTRLQGPGRLEYFQFLEKHWLYTSFVEAL
jgi:hypothetical protein